MTTSLREVEDKRFHSDLQGGFRKDYERAYYAGQDATLADMNLEEGDTLPDISTAEIIKSWFEVDKQSARRIARIKAIEYVTGS